MSLTGCTVGAMVAWPPMRELAENIDALAVALNTPGYTPLIGIADAPFQFTDKVAATGQFYQFFSVSDSGMVEGRYLAADELGAAVYTFPETNLGELIAHDELFFIMDQDDCLCKTLFKVEGSPELPTFVEASASGCCQSIPVPEEDALIYQGQHFFPSAILEGYFGTSFEDCCECCVPSANPTSPACLGSSDATMYVKTGEADDDGCRSVTGVSRNIVSGYFTWPFKKRYMELLVDKLNYILDCERNDGIKPRDAATPGDVEGGGPGETLSMYGALYSVDGGTTNSGWFKQGSTCSPHQVDQWLASLWIEGVILDTEPGTLVYGTGAQIAVASRTKRGNAISTIETRGAEEITDSPYDLPRPWDGPTPPEAADCSNGLPMVYAHTLNKLNDLVTEISERVWPYDTFDAPSHAGTCDETTLVPCCHPDNGYTESSYTARDCEQLGGRIVADFAECQTIVEALCNAKKGRNCGVETDCVYNAGTATCVCPNGCIEEWVCCCPTNPFGSQCLPPPDSLSLSCPDPNCTPAAGCESITKERCCPIGNDDPSACILPSPGPSCPEGYEYETYEELECGPIPITYPVVFTDPRIAPDYPELPPCSAENACCLLHPAFNTDDTQGCLSYLDEITAWVILATDNIINTCQYSDNRLTDPSSEDSPVENCQQIRCGLICEADFATLEESIETCLKQGQIMYSWERREVDPENSGAGWPLSTYYDIVFTAPSPI